MARIFGRSGAYDAALRDFAGPFVAADLLAAAECATGLSDWGGRRWDELRIAFPDAGFYINHRDPAKIVPSIASLFRALRGRFTDTAADPAAIGAQQLAAWSGTMAACVRRRQAGSDHDVVDVHYKALIADPIGTVALLYDRFRLGFDMSLRDRILRHLDRDRHGKGAAHRYSLAEFGLDEVAINAAFGDYIDYFGIERERDR